MKKYPYYFTYGTDDQFPFKGGWTKVFGENIEQAIDIFNFVHPNQSGSYVNSAGIYTEEQFMKTSMYEKNDNLGHGCWETIILTVIDMDLDGEDYDYES